MILAPWTTSWDRNYFGHLLPWLGAWMTNPFVRGGVTGVGLVTALAGLRDLAGALVARHGGPPRDPSQHPPSGMA